MVQRFLIGLVGACLVLTSATVGAQDATSGSIGGVVKDTSGGALPGVTVEVTSPALIEGSRSAVTDSQGVYRIVNLRGGQYSVSFTLPGFGTLKRNGVEVQTGVAATVNAELTVGAVQETITVSGAAPTVDVTNTAQQSVFTAEQIQTLPVGKNAGMVMALLPGSTTAVANVDVAGTKNEQQQNFTMHGGGTIVLLHDGIFVGSPLGGQAQDITVNPASVQETSVQINGSLGAEAQGAGVQVNSVPRDGGNQFHGTFAGDIGSGRWQSNNVDDDLIKRGATQPQSIRKLYDINGGVGGPIVKNKIWFYQSARKLQNQTYVVGIYFNRTPGTLFYDADTSRPAYAWTYSKGTTTRLTWQASSKDKITANYELQSNCNCYNQVIQGGIAPDAAAHRTIFPDNQLQLGWNRIASTRLLVESRFAYTTSTVGNQFDSGPFAPNPTAIAVFDQSKGLRYGSLGSAGPTVGNAFGITYAQSIQGQGTASYVTGSHNVKVGVQLRRFQQRNNSYTHGDIAYTFNGSTPATAQPLSVTYYATPLFDDTFVQQHGLFAQDQWRIGHFTINYGARFDYARGYTPPQHVAAGTWVPARDFPAVNDIPRITDVNPRLGLAWDIFGDGRSALKVSLGRYQPVQVVTGGLASLNNPTALIVTSATRTWADGSNGNPRDFIPQEGELGPLSNPNFGKTVASTSYADNVLHGYGVAPYSWQGGISFQHQLWTGAAVNVGYYRTVNGNFTVTDNALVGPADYDYFCLNAPRDPSLPGGGGQQICGIHDPKVTPQVQNVVRQAKDIGKQSSIYNGVDLTMNARFVRAAFLTGGISFGKQTTNNCDVLAKLPELSPTPVNCDIRPPWSAGTDFKISGGYRLPGDLQMSGNYQNSPGIATTATWNAPNVIVAAALGRNLSACRAGLTADQCTATLAIPIVKNNTLYREKRVNLLAFAFSRNFALDRFTVRPRVELANLLNVNTVTTINTTFATTNNSWQAVRGVLTPRTMKLAVQMEF